MKKISTRVKPLQTGGDGTAYYGEEVIDEKVMTKKDIKKRDEIADAISDKDMKDRYGDKSVKYAIATKIVMDKKKKKKEEMKEELDEKDKPFVKKLVKNLKKGSKTHEKQAEKLEKAMKENTAIESELVIQDWNIDDIKFTEIETVDIIKAKPLKESRDWRLELSEKFGFVKNLGKLKLNKELIRGTNPLPKIKGKIKVPVGKVTKRSFVQAFKAPLNPITTALSKLRIQDATKSSNLSKLSKKYKDLVKKGEKVNIKKKFVKQVEIKSPVSKDKMIMPKKGEIEKTKKLIDKYKNEKLKSSKTDIGAEKKILDAQQDPKLKKLDKVDKSKDKLLDKINEPLTAAQKKGFDRLLKTVDAGRDGMRTRDKTRLALGKLKGKGDEIKSGIKKGLAIGAPAVAGYAVGYDKGLKKNIDDLLSPPPSKGDEEDKPSKNIPPNSIMAKNEKKKKTVMASYDWRAELDEDWQKANRQDKTDGLSKKAVKAYRRENPGSKLQTAVTKDPKKLKKGSKSAKRRLSFCRRMKGMKKKLTSAKTRRDPDSRINKALRRWNC